MRFLVRSANISIGILFFYIFFGGTFQNIAHAGVFPIEGIVPCGNTITTEERDGYVCYVGECSVCHVQVLVLKIIDISIFGISIFATLLFINAGFLYVTSSANPPGIAKAHSIFTNTAIGFVIFLSAYMLVDVVMKTLYANTASGVGPWNAFLCKGATLDANGQTMQCVKKIEQGTLTGVEFEVPTPEEISNVTVPGGPIPDGGVCGTENLKRWFPEDQVGVAHCVCMGESGGNPIPSTIDKCRPNGPSVSWGYWQLNLTVHNPGGLDCPSAFTQAYSGRNNFVCALKPGKESLFEQCKAAANDPTTSFTYAVALWKRAGWTQWGAYKDANCARFAK